MGCISSKDEERENHGFDQVYREKQQVDTPPPPPTPEAYTGIFKKGGGYKYTFSIQTFRERSWIATEQS